MEDITRVFGEKYTSPESQNPLQPKLEWWAELYVSDRVVLSGVIYHHPKHPDGTRIMTSTLAGFESDEQGRVYALTQRSRYALGERLSKYQPEQVSKANSHIKAVIEPGKKTLC